MPDENDPPESPPPHPSPLDYAGPHVEGSGEPYDDEPNAETWADLFRAMGLVIFLLAAFGLVLSLTCGGAACLVRG